MYLYNYIIYRCKFSIKWRRISFINQSYVSFDHIIVEKYQTCFTKLKKNHMLLLLSTTENK